MIDDDHLDTFDERYKIRSARLESWDYSSNGYYHITICTWKHDRSLGKIENNKMVFSKIGEIAKQYLIEIPKHFPNIIICAFAVMPNHIHMLIEVTNACSIVANTDDSLNMCTRDSVETKVFNSVETRVDNSVETPYMASLQNKSMGYLSVKSKQMIPKIIQQYKSAVSRYANQNKILFGWQTGYYDEIIKDKKHYLATKKYIMNNVENWGKDEYKC
ncbi:MAG: transposase [Microgenomates group bacterium]